MEISISEQQFDHIRKKIDGGQYPSTEAVIAKALYLLDQYDETMSKELGEVDTKIREGVDALRDGDYTDYTDETLQELFEDVKRRGRARGSESR